MNAGGMNLRGLAIYETPLHFYIIGADPTRTHYSTLKIDRTAERDLIMGEPDHDYTRADIDELLATVSASSIVTSPEQWNRRTRVTTPGGLLRTVDNAYGIIGVVRFLEVTRAKVVLRIGHHDIYKIEDVSMIYLPACGAPTHPDEQKYSKLFQSVDLTTNFYFSYTYDVSRTLQENALAEREKSRRRRAESKFIWNEFLLKPLRDNFVSEKWTLRIVHGYVGYSIVEIPCAKLVIALLARRSAVFAGTRFLKRGTNFDGAVANDVETEQMVWDASAAADLCVGRFAAYVQRRGSVPLFWSQEPAGRGVVAGKPPIYVDLVEPHALTTGAHFRELRKKYGHPIIVMNLVKRHEKRHNENILHEQFLKTVKYLNEFQSPGRCIDYIGFDVSRCHGQSGQVLQKLEQLGAWTLLRQGWFQSFGELALRRARSHWLMDAFRPHRSRDGKLLLQRGVARTNCVDCLDRTNVAQFGIGFQLWAMGYVDEPLVMLSAEVNRVLEELYDEHGDTLAWQYAGSQLVHSIKTYKRTAVFQERSRDVFQTISRYYSNTFSDYEKQDGINLFLGVFQPLLHAQVGGVTIGGSGGGGYGSDRYLHFPLAFCRKNEFLWWALNIGGSDQEEETEEDWRKSEDLKHQEEMLIGKNQQDYFNLEAQEELNRRSQKLQEDYNCNTFEIQGKGAKKRKRKRLFALDYRDERKLAGFKTENELSRKNSNGKSSSKNSEMKPIIAEDLSCNRFQLEPDANIQSDLDTNNNQTQAKDTDDPNKEIKKIRKPLFSRSPSPSKPTRTSKSPDSIRRSGDSLKVFDLNAAHQKLLEMSMEDWVVVKAAEAALPVETFSEESDMEACYAKHSNCNNTLDAFELAYRTFELSTFDQLVRDSPLTRRVVCVDSLSQKPFQLSAFMTLFKATDPTFNRVSTNGSSFQELTGGESITRRNQDVGDEMETGEELYRNSSSEDYIQIYEERNGMNPPAQSFFHRIQHYQQLRLLYTQQRAVSPPSSASFYYHAYQRYGSTNGASSTIGGITISDTLPTSSGADSKWRRRSLTFADSSQPVSPTIAHRWPVSLKWKKSSLSGTLPAAIVSQRDPNIFSVHGRGRLTLNSGLKSTRQAYGFEYRKPTLRDSKIYERYAAMSTNSIWQDSVIPPKFTNEKNLSFHERVKQLRERYRLLPIQDFKPSFITVDNAFHTELGDVSSDALTVYRSRAFDMAGTRDNNELRLAPSVRDARVYAKY